MLRQAAPITAPPSSFPESGSDLSGRFAFGSFVEPEPPGRICHDAMAQAGAGPQGKWLNLNGICFLRVASLAESGTGREGGGFLCGRKPVEPRLGNPGCPCHTGFKSGICLFWLAFIGAVMVSRFLAPRACQIIGRQVARFSGSTAKNGAKTEKLLIRNGVSCGDFASFAGQEVFRADGLG